MCIETSLLLRGKLEHLLIVPPLGIDDGPLFHLHMESILGDLKSDTLETSLLIVLRGLISWQSRDGRGAHLNTLSDIW